MNGNMTLARDYLLGPVDPRTGLGALWRWCEGGLVVTWPDNTTIAYRYEVEGVLERLAPSGLPPFGAVLLLLSATRKGWPDISADIAARAAGLLWARGMGTPLLGEVMAGLGQVHAL